MDRPPGRPILGHAALGGLFPSLQVTNLRVERIRGVYQRPVTGTGGILHAACGREHAVPSNLPTHAFPARAAAPFRASRIGSSFECLLTWPRVFTVIAYFASAARSAVNKMRQAHMRDYLMPSPSVKGPEGE